jgi:hypothetical protein
VLLHHVRWAELHKHVGAQADDNGIIYRVQR